MNVVEYFNEKYNENKSDGTQGVKKPFYYKTKEKKLKEMAKNFPGSETENKYSSYRNTAPQVLKELIGDQVVYNKRKLTEFPNLMNKMESQSLQNKIMMENIMKDMMHPDSFLMIMMEFTFNKIGLSSNNGEKQGGLVGLLQNMPNMLKMLNQEARPDNDFQELYQEMFRMMNNESNMLIKEGENMPEDLKQQKNILNNRENFGSSIPLMPGFFSGKKSYL